MTTKANSSRSRRGAVSKSTKIDKRDNGTKKRQKQAPISLCISFIIVVFGVLQLVSTFHTYAINLSELNGLKNQQAALIKQKRDLENDIARWDDEAYVTAQARDRLGFVFPGEQAIRVLHPESVTGGRITDNTDKERPVGVQGQTPLPWYQEVAYSLKQADTPINNTPNANGHSRANTSQEKSHKQEKTINK